MPIKIKAPMIESHTLDKCDKLFENTGSATVIKVRQATQGEEEQRNSLYALTERRINPDDSVSFHTHVSIDDVFREEVWLTLADCNIEDSEGEPLFYFMCNRLEDKPAFIKAWHRLDPAMADEIIEKVHETNIQWGPQGNARL